MEMNPSKGASEGHTTPLPDDLRANGVDAYASIYYNYKKGENDIMHGSQEISDLSTSLALIVN